MIDVNFFNIFFSEMSLYRKKDNINFNIIGVCASRICSGCRRTQQLTLHVVLLHLDACLYKGKVKWNEAYLQKLVASCCRVRILFYSWIRQKLRMQILYDGLAEILGRLYCILNYTRELKKSVGSHGTLSLLFVMKMMVCSLVSNCS
jgi:hypothetical protein